MVLRLKHFFRLLRDVVAYSWANEIWWPVPLLLLLLAIGILALTAQVSAPYIYTIF